MLRVNGTQGVRNGAAEQYGMLQRQPDMFIIMAVGTFRGVIAIFMMFMVMLMIVFFVVFMGILGILFLLMVVMMLALLHSLNHFLCFYAVPQHLHQVHGHQIGIGGVGQGVLYPGVRLSSCVEKQVTVEDGNHIIGGRLEAVEIHAIVQEHRQLHMVGPIPQDLPHPVVLRENSGDDP